MAYDCVARAEAKEDVDVRLVVTRVRDDSPSRRLLGLCERHSVEVIDTENPNEERVLRRIREARPDAVFNINGFSILRDELIDIPRFGAVNFHNGPLPTYAGLNIPTWAIWNGALEHGVTWHYIDSGIDTGDLIATSTFSVDARETAISLTMKCILHGINTFDVVLQDVLSGNVSREKQSGDRTYYRRRDVPNDGFIEFDWSAAQVDRLLRALDFHPFPNPLVDPRIRWGDSYISIGMAEILLESRSMSSEPLGTIVEISDEGVSFLLKEGRLIAKSFVGLNGETLDIPRAVEMYGLSLGICPR